MSKQTNKNPSLLLGLFCCSGHYSNLPEDGELSSIRKQMAEEKSSPHHRPYTANKGKVMTYQAIFLGIGAIFLVLASLISSKTTNWTCSLFFASCMAIKTMICSLSLALSFSAFFLGFTLRTDKETIAFFLKRAKRNLKRVYRRKKMELSWKQQRHFRQTYLDSKERLTESAHDTQLLMEQIKHSKEYDSTTKETLLNRASLELHDRLHHIVHSFSK